MKILNKTQCDKFIELAVKELAGYIMTNGLNGITTGISGGIDSSVVAVIGLKTIDYLKKISYTSSFKYLYLDCESDKNDFLKAAKLSDKFNFTLEEINLTNWFRQSPLLGLIPQNHPKSRIAQGNIRVRLRMISLYQTALLNNYIYLDTDDLSEEWMGFWTRHGDEGDVKIIQQITKSEVYDLGEHLGIPQEILESKPGDGVHVTKKNQAVEQLGLEYLYIEYIISRFVGHGFDYNGNVDQLKSDKFVDLLKKVSLEINKPEKSVKKILEQSLKTAYKRRYGDYSARLAVNRKEYDFPEVGSEQFNAKYLNAIIK